jgi:hypothetical protein
MHWITYINSLPATLFSQATMQLDSVFGQGIFPAPGTCGIKGLNNTTDKGCKKKLNNSQ